MSIGADPSPAPATPPTRPGKGSLRSLGWRMVRLALLLYALYLMAVYALQDKVLFPRDMAPPPAPGTPYPGAQLLTRPAGRLVGDLPAWFIPAPRPPAALAAAAAPSTAAPIAADSPRTPVVVFFHGNAENADEQQWLVEGCQSLGLAVFIPEYRGYGRAGGLPSQSAIVDDARQFLDLLRQRPDVDPHRLIYFGRSVGGGVAAELARLQPPAALVLQSTFTSVRHIMGRMLVPPFLVRNPFRVDLAVKTATYPVLLAHGNQDAILPIAHSRRLHALNPRSQLIEFNSDHNDFPGPGQDEAFWNALRAFLLQHRILDVSPHN